MAKKVTNKKEPLPFELLSLQRENDTILRNGLKQPGYECK